MIKNNKKLFNIAIILLLAIANLHAVNTPRLSKFDKRITYAT